MNDQNSRTPTPAITVDDILYVLFRHKWKIVIISSLAVVAAAVVYFFWPLPYRSEARILIKYVVDSRSPGQMGANNSKVTAPDDRGDSILNTELEVLSSFDLALEVAASVGPSNILAKTVGGTNQYAAAAVIQRNLILDVPKKSSVIHLVFQHPDPGMVQPVLKSLIDDYYKRHLEIHRDAGQFGEFLTQQTDQLHSRLVQTEEALRAAKTNAGVISIEDTKKLYSDQVARIQAELLQAEADLAERQAAATEMAKLTHSDLPVLTNSVAATNEVPAPSDKLAEYNRVCRLLDKLSTKQQELLVQFTPENSWVKQLDEQIASNEKVKEKMEEAYPSLATTKVSLPRSGSSDSRNTAQIDMVSEFSRVSGLQSKIKFLTQQLDEIQKNAARMYASEGSISDLQRRYFLQETQYNYFSMSLEQSRIDEALGAGRVSNISQIQAPSPPTRDYIKMQKLSAGILFGGIAFAIGLAFLIEVYLDRSLKRPIEIEAKLGLPLFISIPRFSSLRKARAHKSKENPALLPENSAEAKAAAPEPNSASSPNHSNGDDTKLARISGDELAPWDPRYILRPFAEALRDGLITYFEVNNLTHKPKLVAVTSCTEGSGVSTIAAGLAASLSETGEGNVLLVNMNQANGGVHQFHKGDLTCDLNDVLTAETRDKALVQENLYVANEATNGDKLPIVFPNRFKGLVPRLRASDYDYIIFDMPAVNQISSTQRLARFMDMVLMVVESEKTDRDLAKRVSSLLGQAKTHVGIVLNKTRSHGPRRLQ